jgi:hypothetical protein
MDEVRMWRCGEGHVMGLVVRNGSHVHRLLLYRQAIEMEIPDCGMRVVEGALPEVMAVVEGTVLDVRCSVCGSIRTWAVRGVMENE